MSFKPLNDAEGNPLIQYEHIEKFELRSGETLEQLRLGYCVFSENENNPIIILHPALTGSPRAYCVGKPSQGDGWFLHCVGPGKFLDTNKYRIICFDHLGGNGASTPAEELSSYREKLSFGDEVTLIAKVLKTRNVTNLHAVVGGSIGGGQAFEWLFQRDVIVERIIDVSGRATSNGLASEFFKIQRDVIWGEGKNIPEIIKRIQDNNRDLVGVSEAFDYVFKRVLTELQELENNYSKQKAASFARKVGFFRFVTPKFFQLKWDKYFEESKDKKFAFEQVGAWMDYQGEIFPKRFSADALAQLCHLDASAPDKDPREIAKRINETNTKLTGFSVDGDVLFDADSQRKFYGALKNELPKDKLGLVNLIVVKDEVNGHDHFLTEKFVESVPALRQGLA